MMKRFIYPYLVALIFSTLADAEQSIKKARCDIPYNTDLVTNSLLFQQCYLATHFNDSETACYEELGCFPMDGPWTTVLRPFPPPWAPIDIDVRLYLYTRNQRQGFAVPLWPTINLFGSDFNPRRENTAFITHGFVNNGNEPWLHDLKNAYLLQKDANIFIVDWGKGAKYLSYLQVASNTRIVGAELARFGRYIISLGVNPGTLHLIGHSLGSHISAYMAKGVSNFGKAGRLTALDPAQPGFEHTDQMVRLNVDDAAFVDVIHSDAKPFLPLFGFGLLHPAGHVDFYLNDGTNQPGCYTNLTYHVANIKSIEDLALIPVEVISQIVSCNHGRSYQVFTASLQQEVSCLWGRKVARLVNVAKVSSQGLLHLLDPLVSDISLCNQDTCTVMGHITPYLKGRGIFTVSTTSRPPFCVANKDKDSSIFSKLTSGVLGIGSSITSTITNAATNILTGVTNILG